MSSRNDKVGEDCRRVFEANDPFGLATDQPAYHWPGLVRSGIVRNRAPSLCLNRIRPRPNQQASAGLWLVHCCFG